MCAWQCYFVVWTWREWHRALEEFLGLYLLTTLSQSLKNCSFQRIREWNNTYTLTHIFCGNQRWLQLMRCARTKWPHRRKQRAPSELSLATHAHVVSLGVNTKGQTESLERKSHWKKRRRRKEVLRDSGEFTMMDCPFNLPLYCLTLNQINLIHNSFDSSDSLRIQQSLNCLNWITWW